MIIEFKLFEQQENIIYRLGKETDLIDIKKISNQLRTELGFVMNVVLKIAIDCDELYVAEDDGVVIGFVHFHRRKDIWNTIHELGVRKDYQGKGIGKKLFNMVPKPVRLKTTMDNTKANDFYKLQGMKLFGTEAGKKRGLNVWVKENKSYDNLINKIQSVLTPDLLIPHWQKNKQPDDHPLFGHCYAASEALYHLLGGKSAGYTPMRASTPLGTHWWIRDKYGNFLDPTADQFTHKGFELPYDKGVGSGFLTSEPSKRAKEIMKRVSTLKENINHEDIDPYNEEDWNDDVYQVGDKLICKESIYSAFNTRCLYHVGKI